MKRSLKTVLASLLCICFLFTGSIFAEPDANPVSDGLSFNFNAAEIEAVKNYLYDIADPQVIMGFWQLADVLEGEYNRAVVSLVSDLATNSRNASLNTILRWESPDLEEWYQSQPNTRELYLTTYDQPTQQTIGLHARYVDNGSHVTVIIQHGFRSDSGDMLANAAFYTSLGFNVLLPDARSRGESGGQYMTFGAYEAGDITNWINYEVQNRPNQKIVLHGVSTGAAAVMLSQQTPHPSVVAYIEDSGFASPEVQFRNVLQLVIDYVLPHIPWYQGVDWAAKKDQLFDIWKTEYMASILKADVLSASPLSSVSANSIPKLFIHGTADWFISDSQMDMLYASAQGANQFVKFEGAGHGGSFSSNPEKYTQSIASFLLPILSAEAPPSTTPPPPTNPTPTPIPEDPSQFATRGLTAVNAGKGKVQLTWQPVTGAEGYIIYVYRDNEHVDLGTTTNTHYLDTQASYDYNYYWVFPYATGDDQQYFFGECDPYVDASGILPAPSNLTISSGGGGTVNLTWSPVNEADGYVVYASRAGQEWQSLGDSATTQFTDTAALIGDYNYYWVIAYHWDNGEFIPGESQTEYQHILIN